MNNKIIAAGVVVALCAVALIGVGYAYTAEVTSKNNAFGSDYITVRVGESTSTVWSSKNFDYNTETIYTNEGAGNASLSVKYTSVATTVSSDNSIVINKTAGVADAKVSVKITMLITNLGTGYKELFVNGSNKASLTLDSGTADKTEVTTADINEVAEDVIIWTFNSVNLSSASVTLPVELTCLPNAEITIPVTNTTAMTPGPSVNGISMIITVGPEIISQ